MLRADLHIHSTASDGWLSPSDIVGLASALGFDIISLCDHDTVDGVTVALASAHRHNNLTVIPSVELSTDFGSENIHLLGYWIDPFDATLKSHLEHYAQASTQRVEEMANRLSEGGYYISRKDLVEVADGGMWRRPHLARILVEKGYAVNFDDAFARYIGDEAPYYAPYHHMSTKEGIDLITAAGGLPFLAHPAVSGVLDSVGVISGLGLKGVEAFHSHHSEIETARILELAARYGLLVSGGSDWHGDSDNGIGFGSSMLPEPYLDRFLESNPRELQTR